jgi:hypothetical protein
MSHTLSSAKSCKVEIVKFLTISPMVCFTAYHCQFVSLDLFCQKKPWNLLPQGEWSISTSIPSLWRQNVYLGGSDHKQVFWASGNGHSEWSFTKQAGAGRQLRSLMEQAGNMVGKERSNQGESDGQTCASWYEASAEINCSLRFCLFGCAVSPCNHSPFIFPLLLLFD